MAAVARWTVSVSRDTDIAVRTFLAQRGSKKGDLSKFIEEAVKWRVFDQDIIEARTRFGDLPQSDVEAVIADAIAAARSNPAAAE